MRRVNLTDNIFYIDKHAMEGGNAFVYHAQYNNKDGYVVKILKKGVKPSAKRRFLIEIAKVQELQDDIFGVIPILESGLESEPPWYLMPKAIPISHYLKKKEEKILRDDDFNELEIIKLKVSSILELSKVLSNLHAQNIHHRDIKPSNLYYYNKHLCFSDFGLVDFPEKPKFTPSKERIGPQGYLPDEMRSRTKGVDFKKVDVYELAKTLWSFLTNKEDIFQGKYDEDDSNIGISHSFKNTHHLVELEELLLMSTQTIPALRPNINEFISKLEKWFHVIEDITERNISQWDYIKKKFFPKVMPATAIFDSIEDIIYILNMISRLPGINHMFVPDGGGLDLRYVEEAGENNCITMNADGLFLIIKPKHLLIENIDNDPLWSYILLEADTIDPIENAIKDDDEAISPISEKLTEITPGEYGNWLLGNYRKYSDGTDLPDSARIVDRYLEGKFVFFPKASIYNHTPATYDGRHNKLSAEKFRLFVNIMRISAYTDNKMYNEIFNKVLFNDASSQPKIENSIPSKYEMDTFDNFISEKFKEWNFSDICVQYKKELSQPSLFYIEMEKSIITFGGGKEFDFQKKYLSKESLILTTSSFNEELPHDAFLFATYNDAMDASKEMIKRVQTICEENDINWLKKSIVSFKFRPNMYRNIEIKPTHLFTRQEIHDVLRAGDDSKYNVLVIDMYGYCQLVEFNEHIRQYPVRHEAYHPYNNYVGKFSDLGHVEQEYLYSLLHWLNYLKYGTPQFSDVFFERVDETQIIKEIMSWY